MKLGELIKHRKGFITIDDEKEYKLCRVQLHRRGVVIRETIKGNQIRTKKQQLCKAGDFLVAEMDAKVGGYGFIPEELDDAIVSSHYFLFELDRNKIRPKYLEVISKLQILQEQIKAVGSTNYAAIRPIHVLNWEIPYVGIERQAEIEILYDFTNEKGFKLSNELTHQLDLVKQLRQAFLREAMQGKLTAKWRADNLDIEPANELLTKIKAEKEKLVKEGKLKKEKPLPPIKEDEIPFQIPESWEWCRLGEICEIKGGKRVPNGYQLLKTPTPYIYIRVSDMKNGTISEDDLHYIDEIVYQQIKNYTISKEDIYMTIVGGTIGKCGLVPEKFDNMNLTENAAKIIPLLVDRIFLWNCLNSPFCQSQFNDKTKQVGVQKMALNRFTISLIPLPPSSEQQQIVTKLDELMQYCDGLEKSIKTSQQQNEMLLQQVLREALGVGKIICNSS